MINVLTPLVLISWPLGQLAILPQLFGLNWTFLDLLASLLWIALLFGHPRKIFNDPLFKPLAVFILAALLSLTVNAFRLKPSELVTASSYLFRFIASLSVYFAFRQTKIKPRLIWVSLFAFVVLGLLQYLFLPDMRYLKNFGFDDHYFRLVGTLLDPNYTGLILTQIVLLSLFYLKGKNKLFSLLPLVALSLTFSRASYLAFAVALIYVLFRARGQHLIRHLHLYLAVLIFLIWVIPKPFGEGVNLLRTFSITSRLDNQQQALNLFLERPVFGWGFNTLKRPGGIYPNRVGGFDNSFLYILATTGVVGFFTFIYLLYRIWYLNRASQLITSLLIAVCIHSLFNNSFFFLWESVLFWACLGYISTTRK